MKPPVIDGGMCPVCIFGPVKTQLTPTLIPFVSECQSCGHRFDPLEEDSK